MHCCEAQRDGRDIQKCGCESGEGHLELERMVEDEKQKRKPASENYFDGYL